MTQSPNGGLTFREAFAPDSALPVVAHQVNDCGLNIDRICLPVAWGRFISKDMVYRTVYARILNLFRHTRGDGIL
jgi:hypothetical protein